MINYESTETIVLRCLAMKVCSYNATYIAPIYLCILHIISLLRAFTKVRKGNISFLFLSICLFIYPSTSLSECSNFTATIQSFRFLWPCIVSNVWRERKNQQDATIRCLLSTSVSTCFGPHYAHLHEIKDRVLLHTVYCAGSAGCGW